MYSGTASLATEVTAVYSEAAWFAKEPRRLVKAPTGTGVDPTGTFGRPSCPIIIDIRACIVSGRAIVCNNRPAAGEPLGDGGIPPRIGGICGEGVGIAPPANCPS